MEWEMMEIIDGIQSICNNAASNAGTIFDYEYLI